MKRTQQKPWSASFRISHWTLEGIPSSTDQIATHPFGAARAGPKPTEDSDLVSSKQVLLDVKNVSETVVRHSSHLVCGMSGSPWSLYISSLHFWQTGAERNLRMPSPFPVLHCVDLQRFSQDAAVLLEKDWSVV